MIRKRWVKPLASLKLAIFILTALAVITAVGTIIEARYDAYAAKKWVYGSFWLSGILLLLVVNLTAVIVDRWPWKRRHVAFISAHVGIIILIVGAYLTMKWGLDGNLVLATQDSNRFVQTQDTEIAVYSSLDGDRFVESYRKPVDFFLHPPAPQAPIKIPTLDGEIQVLQYKKYVHYNRHVEASESPQSGSGVRIQIVNDRMSQVEWIVQSRKGKTESLSLGPLQVHLGEPAKIGRGFNEIFLVPKGERLSYVIFDKDELKKGKDGFVSEGGEVHLPWMGMRLKVLRYLPEAVEAWEVEEKEFPSPLTTSAIELSYKKERRWLLLNDQIKFFSDQGVSLMSFRNSLVELPFSLFLKEFQIEHYQGTQKAKSYKSIVTLQSDREHEISMNEPLQHEGLTFYQASFQNDATGRPVRSILSVNYDPGRWLKYLGSLLITVGVILLFYFKSLDFRIRKGKL